MADDEFDIDIYGDANTEQEQDAPFKKDEEGDVKIEGIEPAHEEPPVVHTNGTNGVKHEGEIDGSHADVKTEGNNLDKMNGQQKIKSTDESGSDVLTIPKQAPQQQGVKRKEGSDDRPIDPGATTALLISELHWWNTDDDVRGWVNQAQVEDELKDITFSEHKVNGKSKGQAYVEFTSQQAATAAKQKIDAFGAGQTYVKKHTVAYSNPNTNPFRTLPKDAPVRTGKETASIRGSSNNYNDRGNQNSNFGGGFRGRGQSYSSNRGGINGNSNGNNFNRNFSGPAMGGNMGAGYSSPMGGFSNNPMGGQFAGGGFNRGGMMGGMRGGPGMRGGRGGMNNMMGGMPMGGMPIPMGGMPVGMGMPMNMGQMGGGMQGKINPNLSQVYPQAGQNNMHNGKAHSTFNYGTPLAVSNTPPSSSYQRPTGVPGSSPYGAPQTHGNGYMTQQKLPYTKKQSHHAAGGGFQPHFNPAFFQQNQAAGGDWQNPHGAKRPRPE